jgi:hypothetical protein
MRHLRAVSYLQESGIATGTAGDEAKQPKDLSWLDCNLASVIDSVYTPTNVSPLDRAIKRLNNPFAAS